MYGKMIKKLREGGKTMEERKFLCTESFMTEERYCLKDEVYTAVHERGTWKFLFENGEMNFTEGFFEKVMEAWSDALTEITVKPDGE